MSVIAIQGDLRRSAGSVSISARKEKIALVGPNGAGKSTLLTMFNGMIRPDSGLMLFDNQPIGYDKASLRTLRKRVGFVLQNPDRQIIAPTVYQDVAFGPTNLGHAEQEVKEAVTTALRQVGLEGFERRPPHRLLRRGEETSGHCRGAGDGPGRTGT